MPICNIGYGPQAFQGLIYFLFGILGMVMDPTGLIWLANPFLLFAWILGKKFPKIGLILGSIGFVIALAFLFCNYLIVDEAGHRSRITAYYIGYWLWLASFVSVIVHNLLKFRKNENVIN